MINWIKYRLWRRRYLRWSNSILDPKDLWDGAYMAVTEIPQTKEEITFLWTPSPGKVNLDDLLRQCQARSQNPYEITLQQYELYQQRTKVPPVPGGLLSDLLRSLGL